MNKIRIFTFSLLVTLFSCDSADENPSNNSIAKLDLTNTKALFIASGELSGGRAAADVEKIYKVTDDGLVIQVTFTNEAGETIQIEKRPTNIVNVNSEFIIVVFQNTEGYLVRKSDGSVFDLSGNLPTSLGERQLSYYGDYVAEDNGGNIYFIGGTNTSELIKIDISNPAQLTKSTHSATGDHPYTFVLDPQGNAAYLGTDNGGNQIIRYKKASGGLELLPGSTNHSHTTFWTDFSGNMYYYNGSIPQTIYTNYVLKITPSPFELSSYGTNDLEVGCGFKSLLKIPSKERIIAPGGCSYVYELYNDTGEPRNIPYSTFDITSIKLSAASDNYYYMSGTSEQGKAVLMKIDPADDSYTYLINGEYDLYKMTVSQTDEIIFNALRLSDGKIVIGQISSAGQIEILDESLTQEVTILEKVN